MTMGQRIRAARLEAGLSQRELAGEEMTRNMLSTLEHDGAKPSVGTLIYLSNKLCKPVGYFFGEIGLHPENVGRLDEARSACIAEEYEECLELLKEVDPVFQGEVEILRLLACLGIAEKALEEGRRPYARTLLEDCRKAGDGSAYFSLVERRWALLMAKAGELSELKKLDREDEALMLRVEAALDSGKIQRAAELLNAVENRNENWHFLRGEVYWAEKRYEKAAEHYHKAEGKMEDKTCKKLEICYREMGDFRMAYYYATRKQGPENQ